MRRSSRGGWPPLTCSPEVSRRSCRAGRRTKDGMAGKRSTPEEIVGKLRQVEVLTGQGKPVAGAIRAIGVSEPTYYLWRAEAGPGASAEAAGTGEWSSAPGDLGPDVGEADPEGSRPGKLPSAARRRRCAEHVTTELDGSERMACRVPDQHRSTQRKAPSRPDDEAALSKHHAGSADAESVAGVDGVGTDPQGRRVYFLFPRAAFRLDGRAGLGSRWHDRSHPGRCS